MSKNIVNFKKEDFLIKASGLIFISLLLTFIITNFIKNEISIHFENQSIKEQTRLLDKIISLNTNELNNLTETWLDGNTYKLLQKDLFQKEKWEGRLIGLSNATKNQFGSEFFITYDKELNLLNQYNTYETQKVFNVKNENFIKILKHVKNNEITTSDFIITADLNVRQISIYPIMDDMFNATNYFAIITNLNPIVQRFRDITGLKLDLAKMNNTIVTRKKQKNKNEIFRKISSAHLQNLNGSPYFKVYPNYDDLEENLLKLMSKINIILVSLFILFAYTYYNISKKLNIQKANTLETSRLSSLGEMAGSIAHEINNPLTIIQGHAIKLKRLANKEKLTSEEVLKSSENINNVIIRITNIIQSLKNLSRNDENAPFKKVFTDDLIKDAIYLSEQKFKRNGIEIIYTNNASGSAVLCRRVEISRIIINLLNNAFDALMEVKQPTKQIQIVVDSSPSFTSISVMDNGPGIPQELLVKIMDPFFTTKEVGSGTGLGLSMSQKIAKQHNGSLSVQSAPGKTIFLLNLPNGEE